MASNENKENEATDSSKEQEVTIEKVVAKDNKGIDYDKLISEFLNLYSYTFFVSMFRRNCSAVCTARHVVTERYLLSRVSL